MLPIMNNGAQSKIVLEVTAVPNNNTLNYMNVHSHKIQTTISMKSEALVNTCLEIKYKLDNFIITYVQL